jgi:outer membrane protein assembly factor BamA
MRWVCAWLALLLVWLPFPATAKTTDEPHLVVEALRCRGNVNTSCRFILGSVYLAPGDRLNEDEIQNARLRLSWLRNFKSVDIHLEKGSARGRVIVVVEVSEASPVTGEASVATERLADSWTQVVAARATDYNLFGTGKILDAQATTRIPLAGPELENFLARLQYVDPHLFDTQRYFMAAGLFRHYSHFEFENGDSYAASIAGADISLGRRLFSFSYLTLGYQFRPVADITCHIRQSNGSFQSFRFDRSGTVLASLGTNTQDDAVFPTQGLLAQLFFSGSRDCSDHLSFQADKVFRLDNANFLEIRGQSGELGIRYSRNLAPEGLFSGIQRGRWYVEPSLRNVEYGIAQKGGAIRQLALRLGVRFEIASLGVVDLSIYGTTDRRTEAGP